MPKADRRRFDRVVDIAARALLQGSRLLPYRWRVPAVGWLTSRIVAPLAGWPARIDANLDHAMPEIAPGARKRLRRAVADNVGRTLAEIYAGPRFARAVAGTAAEGPGWAVLDAARDAGRPAVLVTAHLGNFDAPRVMMLERGYRLGGLYRPMRNAHFNRHYEAALASIGTPIFPTGRHGLGRLLRHLRDGGMVGLLVDIYAKGGADLTFFGRSAPTALSAAELALRHDAPLVPVYSLRRADGLSFRVIAETPVPRGTPREMTQALNDSLERIVRQEPGQWF